MADLLVGSLKRTAQPSRSDSTAHVGAEYSCWADQNPSGPQISRRAVLAHTRLAGQHARSCYSSSHANCAKAAAIFLPILTGPLAAAHSSKYSSTVSSVGSAVP